MIIYLPEIVKQNGALDFSKLPTGRKTEYLSVTGQDGSGKTNLRDGLANYYSNNGNIIITAKSPCDKYIVGLLNNAISQKGYEDWYTEQLLFSFTDGLLSNYMIQLDGKCDYFICQRGPIDQYAHGITRSGKSYETIHEIQQPERLKKFDTYIHLNCDARTAWNRICDDEGKDRYEYPEYFNRQVENTRQLYLDIMSKEYPELEFLQKSRHFYIDTSDKTIEQVRESAINMLEK